MPTEASGTQRRSSTTPGATSSRMSAGRCELVPAANRVGEREQRVAPARPPSGTARAGSTPSRRSDQSASAASPRSRTSATMSRDLASRQHPLDGNEQDRGGARRPRAGGGGARRRRRERARARRPCPARRAASRSARAEPGTSAQISSSASSGAFSIRYRASRASTTLREDRGESERARRPAPRRPTSTASDEKSEPSERRPFVRSVLPLETRSTIASASPSRGATSTEPVTSTSSTTTSALGEQARGEARVDGRDAAPAELVELLDRRLLGHGGLERAAAEAEPQQLGRRRAPRSATRSAPVIPQSTTPSWTYSGMSAARTSSTSTGAFRQGNASARSPGSSGPRPASSSSAIDGLAQPALGRDGDLQAVGREASADGRAPPVAALAVAQPVRHPRHRRRRRARLLRDLLVRQALVQQLRHLPAVRHRLQLRSACRGPGGSAPPRPVSSRLRIASKRSSISAVRHGCDCSAIVASWLSILAC